MSGSGVSKGSPSCDTVFQLRIGIVEVIGYGKPSLHLPELAARRRFVWVGQRADLGEGFVAVAEDDSLPRLHQTGIVSEARLDLIEVCTGHDER